MTVKKDTPTDCDQFYFERALGIFLRLLLELHVSQLKALDEAREPPDDTDDREPPLDPEAFGTRVSDR